MTDPFDFSRCSTDAEFTRLLSEHEALSEEMGRKAESSAILDYLNGGTWPAFTIPTLRKIMDGIRAGHHRVGEAKPAP